MRDIAIENYSEREIINGFEEIHMPLSIANLTTATI
ncbi:MAG: hypothetical protein Ct9H90mP22_3560 [Gammaproteobacteria bacterium]|nr:MAG: hypothetical protein Ct9H90mP22_3560 [Gammaproteobacteria bacterium]